MSNINCATKMSLRLLSLKRHGCVNVKILSRFFGDNAAAQEPDTSEQHGLKKLIKVAVLGTPNAGKSTLINNLCAMPLCPASKKVHTTKSLVRAVCHIENTQVVFLDTPGLLSEKAIKKYKFPQKMVDACAQGKNLSDLVAVLYDVSSHHPPALPPEIIPFLRKNHPAILVLNKVDMIKSKRRLLEITRLLAGTTTVSKKRGEVNTDLEESVFTENNRGYKNFLEVFLISALKGDGLDKLMKYFVEHAIPSEHIHPLAPIDIPPEQFVVETVRAKLLNFLPRELPYIVIPELELFEENSDGSIVAAVRLRCPTQRIANVIAGVECGRLFQMQNTAREDITKVFGVPFTLVLQTDPPVTDNRKSHQVPMFDPKATKIIV